MTGTCEVRIAHPDPGTAVLELHGVVDGAASGLLPASYDTAVAQGPAGVLVLDFTDVEYINSTGIALVVSLLAKARAEGRVVRAAGLSEHYRHIFTITRLSDFIDMYADVDTAVRVSAAAQA